jgi:CheY-like chemotaxis protein
LARILYVDDDEFWRNHIAQQMRGHHVDTADSFQAAVDLLNSESAYAVALVDLNLRSEDDGEGGELLDLLRLRHPATKRIVVTGFPPGGDVGKRIFEAYDVEALIIKRDFSVPDLRRVVEEAIVAQPGELPQTMRLSRWLVRQRLRDWLRMQSNQLKDERDAAEEHLSDATGLGPQTRQRAEEAAVRARERMARFAELSTYLRRTVLNISSEADLDAALEALENAEEQFSEDGDEYGQP